jgi:hypothetical protein
MRQWGAVNTVRSIVVRALLRGQLVDAPDPRGIRLHSARLEGVLDLQNLVSESSLELYACYLPGGVEASFSSLTGLDLARCRVERGIRMRGARIRGQLNLSGATLISDSGPALDADNLQVEQDLFLREQFTATGSGELATVRLPGASIGGQLVASGAKLTNESGPALRAQDLHVDQGMFLVDNFTATGVGWSGAVVLSGAHIGGQLNLSGATVTNDYGPALEAESLQVDQSMFLRDQFTASGAGAAGAVVLSGAHIGGQLSARGAKLTNDSGPALMAENLQVDQSLILRDQFTANGSGKLAAVRLPGAEIGGQLDATGAKLTNGSGPALTADNLRASQGIHLEDQFTAFGAGELPAVRLSGAKVGGQLNLSGAKLTNDSGPALAADSCTSTRTCTYWTNSPPPAPVNSPQLCCPAPTLSARCTRPARS